MTVPRRVWRHRRGWLAALALAVVAGVIVAAVLAAGSPSPTTAANAAKASAGAATVRRRNLVQTDTEAGTLSYANPQTVYDRLSGTVTWLPSVGQVIQPGGVLYRVNGEPVLLMNGNTPAYRTLSAVDSDGADVLALNRNLRSLGFNADGITADDVWQPGTTLGVELLQESLGETATGSLMLGHVVFLPGPQLISTVQGTLGATDNGGSSGQPASGPADPPAPQFVSLESSSASATTATTATTTTTTPTTSTPTAASTPSTPSTTPSSPPPHKRHRKHGQGPQPPSLAALLALLRAEEAQLKAQAAQLKAEQQQGAHGNSPSSSNSNSGGGNKGSNGGNKGSNGGKKGSNGGNGGSNGGNSGGGNGSADGSTGQAILQTTSTDLVVTVDLDASLQSEAKVGERVTVQMPAGNIVRAKVTAVSSVATSSSNSGDNSGNGGGGGGNGGGGGGGGGGGNGSGSSSTIPVTVTLAGRHTGAGLDEAAVSVNFAQRRAKHVLSVPVTALLAVSGGNYAVQEAAAPHTRIPVTVGLFAAGYVQISGPGIYPGLQVTDSQG